jgi:flagellar motor switch protein FliG
MDQVTSMNLTGRQKAATLLMLLGVERSSEILKHINAEELEKILLTIADVKTVPAEISESVLKEVTNLATKREEALSGGVEYTRQLINRAVDPRYKAQLLESISRRGQPTACKIIETKEPSQIARLLEDEHPQAVAVILSTLEEKPVADILAQMAPERQAEISKRLAQMEHVTPQVVRVVEAGLQKKLSNAFSVGEPDNSWRVSFLVKVLNLVDREVQKTIIDSLETVNPSLAENIRANLFTFDDLIKLDDRAMQRALRDVDKQDLALALKGAPESICELIYRNLSERARENLKEEIEVLGPQLARNVYAAQRRIVDVIRSLEEAEEIVIAGSGAGDEIIY